MPLTSIFRPRWWLWLWALLGVRNEYQPGLSARQVVEKNVHFLAFGTNYLPVRKVRQEFTRRFGYVLHSHRARALAKVWFGATMYGLLRERFLHRVREPATEVQRRRDPAASGYIAGLSLTTTLTLL